LNTYRKTLTLSFGSSFLFGFFSPSSLITKKAVPSSTILNMADDRRVVVTGMGIVSCLGNSLEDVKDKLHKAEAGITFQDEFAKLGIKSQVAGVPDLTDEDFVELIPKAALRFMGTNARYAYIALDRAIQDSGLKPEEYQENPRVAAIIGQGGTSIPDIVETCDAVLEGGKRWKNKVGPFRVTRSMGSTCSAVLATNFKVQGPSFSISSACSTGAHCIGTGFEQIKLDKCDMAFCGAGMLGPRDVIFVCRGKLSKTLPVTVSKRFLVITSQHQQHTSR
jgi:3-oxoacyl-[acyl-carrier-protein] synthase I